MLWIMTQSMCLVSRLVMLCCFLRSISNSKTLCMIPITGEKPFM